MSGATSGRIVFDGVWKRFQRGERVDSLRDLLPWTAKKLLRRGQGASGLSSDDSQGNPGGNASGDPGGNAMGESSFWALRDVSFEVPPGRILGIIGPNGAGKSTILKLSTGLMHPTRGRIEVTGRVGALIEIAAGFHPDLTGRENVFLQGAVMGMSRPEIARRFDEIVSFAELADFIDTPVKRYSSGMNARLGFSIAAHLEPDVLLVDEVLSVGDMVFQQKAMTRLSEIVARGIPVLIVSHQLERLAGLCDEAILLGSGDVVRRGDTIDCIAAYVEGAFRPAGEEDEAGWAALDPESLRPGTALDSGDTLTIRLAGMVREPGIEVGVQVRSLPDGRVVFGAFSGSCGVEITPGQRFDLEVSLDMNVGPGVYGISPYLLDSGTTWERWRGGVVTVRVDRPKSAFGRVDLNPRMRRHAP